MVALLLTALLTICSAATQPRARGFAAREFPSAPLGPQRRPQQADAASLLHFSPAFGDSMVLQRGPAQAAVYGTVNGTAAADKVRVTVSGGGQVYSVAAAVTGQTW